MDVKTIRPSSNVEFASPLEDTNKDSPIESALDALQQETPSSAPSLADAKEISTLPSSDANPIVSVKESLSLLNQTQLDTDLHIPVVDMKDFFSVEGRSSFI